MKTSNVYITPKVVVVEISTEAPFAISFYGENIEEWEDM